MREAEIMLRIPPHENVTLLCGVILRPLALVIEFVNGGSLDQLLGIDPESSNANKRILNSAECLHIALVSYYFFFFWGGGGFKKTITYINK